MFRLDKETVWLTQSQISELFQRDQSVIAWHIRNIFREKELDEESNMHFLHNTLDAPSEGIFYDGQIFDAYTFVADLIRSVRKSIALIDNYVDDTVLKLLSKRAEGVSATIFTRIVSALCVR